MSAASSLIVIRDNYLVILESLSTSPKPSYSVNDRSVSWETYQKMLINSIRDLNEQINELEPYEIRTKYVV